MNELTLLVTFVTGLYGYNAVLQQMSLDSARTHGLRNEVIVWFTRPRSFRQCLWRDLLHAVAGLCSVALPDMEETAIYSSLTRSGSKAIILTAEHSGRVLLIGRLHLFGV